MTLCSDCPPANYPTDKTRCNACPRRHDNRIFGSTVQAYRPGETIPEPVVIDDEKLRVPNGE